VYQRVVRLLSALCAPAERPPNLSGLAGAREILSSAAASAPGRLRLVPFVSTHIPAAPRVVEHALEEVFPSC